MAEAKPLKDKIILITGAGQGLGAATAKYLAARGAIVSIADISEPTIKAVEQSLRNEYPESRPVSYVVDVRDSGSVKKWIDETKERFGRIDGCVNNAAVFPKQVVPITELELEDWQHVLDVNLTGTFLCLKHELGAIAAGGSIVNVSSVAGWAGLPRLGSYVASKHGVVGLTKAAAIDAAGKRVRVNAVCPHLMETPMVAKIREKVQGKLDGESATLLEGPMEPEDCAALIAFLLGDESRYITKAVYKIDCGFTG